MVRRRLTLLAGVPIRHTTTRALVRFFDRRNKINSQVAVGFVNHNFILACRGLHALARADPDGILLLDDGVGVEIAARLFVGHGFAENLNGTDLVPVILRDVKRDLDIFLIGGSPKVVARAATLISAMPRRRIVGAIDGFSIWRREKDVIASINAAQPDLVLVGFGNPKQEQWILTHRRELKTNAIFGVGALFEWMTGSRSRAPYALRRARLEWLWRLALEPQRLWKRYTIDIVRFFVIVWRDRYARRGGHQPMNAPNAINRDVLRPTAPNSRPLQTAQISTSAENKTFTQDF